MKVLLVLPPVLLALLLFPAVTAATMEAELEAEQLRGQGAVDAEGPLIALLHPYVSNAGASMSGFQVTAEHVRVESDYANVSVVVPGVVNQKALPATRVAAYSNATLASGTVDPGYRFHVFSSETDPAHVSLSSSCMSQGLPDAATMVYEPRVQQDEQRPDTVIDTSQASRWQACDGETVVEISGDFWFSAWAIDLTVKDASGTHAYWSGHRDNQVVTQDQELYVFVTNGTMLLSLTDPDYALFLAPGTMDLSGSLHVLNARGALTTPAGPLELMGQSITIDGAFAITTRTQHDGLAITLAGDAEGAIVNGQSLRFSMPVDHDGLPWLWITAAPVVLLLGAFVFAPQAYYRSLQAAEARKIQGLPGDSWSQRQSSAFTVMARNANQRDHPGSALAMATFASWFNDHPQARIVMAKAYKRLGWTGRALRVHERLDQILTALPKEQARNAWHAHRVAQGAGRLDQADKWLELARNRDPIEFLRLSDSWPQHRDAPVHDAAFT